jgi:hypothetical protein
MGECGIRILSSFIDGLITALGFFLDDHLSIWSRMCAVQFPLRRLTSTALVERFTMYARKKAQQSARRTYNHDEFLVYILAGYIYKLDVGRTKVVEIE